jgi:hypothetical protein
LQLEVKPSKAKKRVPELLTDSELVGFYEEVWHVRNSVGHVPEVRPQLAAVEASILLQTAGAKPQNGNSHDLGLRGLNSSNS